MTLLCPEGTSRGAMQIHHWDHTGGSGLPQVHAATEILKAWREGSWDECNAGSPF